MKPLLRATAVVSCLSVSLIYVLLSLDPLLPSLSPSSLPAALYLRRQADSDITIVISNYIVEAHRDEVSVSVNIPLTFEKRVDDQIRFYWVVSKTN